MKGRLFAGLLCFIAACSVSLAATAAGEDQVREERPCHIDASVEWNIEEDGKIREGSLHLTANGSLKLSEQLRKPVSRMQGNVNYEIEHLGLFYSYNERITEKNPSFCRENPVLEEWLASGSYRFGGGDPSGAGLYIRNVGTMAPPASMIKGAGPGAEQFLAMLQAQAPQVATNYYEFFGFGTPPAGVKKGIELTGRVRKADCTFRDASKSLDPAVAIRMKIPEDGNLKGEDSWRARYSGGMSLSKLGVSDLPETMEKEPYKPAKVGAGGDITYRLKWSFEEVKPEIRIYRVAKDDEKSKDITGEEVEVMIGEKVTLVVKALGLVDYRVEEPTWKIDGRFIEDFQVKGQGEDTRTELDREVDLKSGEVRFVWTRGDFSGQPMQVRVTGQVGGKDASGETTFKVFAPKIVNRRVRCSPHVTLGDMFDPTGRVQRESLDNVSCAQFDANPEKYFDGLNRYCSVYAGQVRSLCDERKMERGITAEHTVELPWIPEKAYAIQYVQLIIEDSSTTNYGGKPKTRSNTEWCIDTKYPYSSRTFTLPTTSDPGPGDSSADGSASCSGPRCGVRMEDTPGLPLEQGSLIVLHHGFITHRFQTYLMFRPSNRESDEDTIWIPLAVIGWGWLAEAERRKDDSGQYLDETQNFPCEDAYEVLDWSSPSEWGCTHTMNPDFPEWSCNVKKNDRR